MRVVCILLGINLSALCFAQQQTAMQALRQLRQRVAEKISRIPRYLCTETVERHTFQLTQRTNSEEPCREVLSAYGAHDKHIRLQSSDRLHLDVAVIDKREMYSWVGEQQFGNQALSELVNSGLTSTGSFGSFLNSIFLTGDATFSYLGESQLNGRHVWHYGFQVPLARSNYKISNGQMDIISGYSGEFSADAATLDLLSLNVHADAIPKDLKFCEIVNTMDYAKLRMNNVDFLLPSEAMARITASNGLQSLSQTVFTGCHEFLGESKLIVDDQKSANVAESNAASKTLELPAGQDLFIALAEKIDPASAAAGDLVRGQLTKAVNIPEIGLSVPKGTLAHGRICALAVRYGDYAGLDFGLKWESMEVGGIKQPLRISLQAASVATAKTGDVQIKHPEMHLGTAIDDTIGTFVFPYVKKNYQIPAGFASRWLSLPAVSK